jgi:hypothetical protein
VLVTGVVIPSPATGAPERSSLVTSDGTVV